MKFTTRHARHTWVFLTLLLFSNAVTMAVKDEGRFAVAGWAMAGLVGAMVVMNLWYIEVLQKRLDSKA